MKKPKRVRFKVATYFGMYELQAYDLGSGVFLHRPTSCAPTTKTLRGVRTLKVGWVVSATNGLRIKGLHRAHTIAEIAAVAKNTLCRLSWRTVKPPPPQQHRDARLLFIKELKEWP